MFTVTELFGFDLTVFQCISISITVFHFYACNAIFYADSCE